MSCPLRDLTASQHVAFVTRSDTGSHNSLDLIQSLVPPHYVCNGYLYPPHYGYKRMARRCTRRSLPHYLVMTSYIIGM